MEEKRKVKKSYIVLACFCGLALLSSIIFLGYTLLFCGNQTNRLFLIISSFMIFIFVSLFSVSSLIGSKFKNILLSVSAFIITLFIIFNILVYADILKIPTQAVLESLVNKNINEVLIWGEKNKITINQSFEYSDTTKEYYIISQDVVPNTLLKKVKEINVVVSSGPNYDKIFVLQNLVGLKIDDVLEIINNNFMNNVNIEYEINEDFEKDTVIKQNINGQIKRNDRLELVVSLGSESDLEPVKMENLKNKSLFEATLWLKRYGFKYELTYEFSENIKRDFCIGQSEKEGNMVDPKETTIKLIMSKGKEINVPDFTTMSVTEATNWIVENNLKLNFKEAYDNEIKTGDIISSNYMVNTKIEEGTTIELTISKGRLKMENFNNITDFRNWANSLGLEYEENSEFNDNDIGSIISTSPNTGEYINLSDKIYVTYSKGKSTTIPNFYNKSKNEANTLCSNYNLKCYFNYKYSNTISEDYVISQSMSNGSTVAVNTSVTITLSKGKEPVQPKPVECDRNITEVVYLQTGNTGEQTLAMLKKRYPKIKWNPSFEDKCSNGNAASGTICNSSLFDGKALNYCDNQNIIIVK